MPADACCSGFCTVKERDCRGDASATGTFHSPTDASTTAAMNLFFIPFLLPPLSLAG
jgi:hypothetical protein